VSGPYVAVDLHRRRSVIVGQDADGAELLPWARIANDPDRLVAEVLAHGESPTVAIEATYGWYWAVDALQAAGADVRLVAPAQVAAFDNASRRVKNDLADCRLSCDLMRANRLPEAWIAPPAVRDLRELVRYRAKLVGIRTSMKAQVQAVFAKAGLHVNHSQPFDTASGKALVAHVTDTLLAGGYQRRVRSLLELIDVLDHVVDDLDRDLTATLENDGRYLAVRAIPGVGKVLAPIFIAEIGDTHRFASAAHLASWCGLTPRHRQSDTKVRRGPITKAGNHLTRWAAIQAAHRAGGNLADWRTNLAERRGNKHVATTAAARKIVHLVYYGMRDGHIRSLASPTG
jgi:transposase